MYVSFNTLSTLWGGCFSLRSRLRVYWVLLSLAVFWSFHSEYLTLQDFYNQKRIILLSLYALSVPLFFSRQFCECCFSILATSKFACFGLVVFAFFGFISVLSSPYFLLSLHEWLNVLFLFCFVVVISAAIKLDIVGFNLFFRVLVFTVALYLFKFVVVLMLATINGGLIKPSLMLSGAVNVNFIAQPLGLLAPFFAVFAVGEKGWSGRLVFALLVSVILLMLVIDNRGVLVSMALVSIFWALWQNKNVLVVTVLAGFIAFAIYLVLIQFAEVVSVDDQVRGLLSSAGRGQLWLESFRMWRENLWFGIGPYMFALDSSLGNGAHPHNLYLQLLSEWGGLAFSALSVVFLYAFYNALIVVKIARDNVMLTGSFLGVLEGVLHSGLSGVLVMPLSQTIFVILIAVFISSVSLGADEGTHKEGGLNVRCLFFACSVFGGVMFFLSLSFWVGPWIEDACVVNVDPRFWVDGGLLPCPR